MWFWGAYQATILVDPSKRCCDGIHPNYLTCGGPETVGPEPYLSAVLGDHRSVIMCEVHRANSQRDANEALISREDIKWPTLTK